LLERRSHGVTPRMLGSITVKLVFTAPAPPAAAWASFTAVTRWPEVLPDIAAARIEPEGELTRGAVIKTIAKPERNIIDMSYRIIAAEPQQLLTLQSRAEGYRADTTYAFEPLDRTNPELGTRLTVSATVTPERLRGRIVAILWRSKVAENIERAVTRRTTALLALVEPTAGIRDSGAAISA
jgi:hypothetical protein